MIKVPEGLLFDLSLNLTAELVGIVATVFLVDRLLRKREKKRWLPAKNLVYSELLVIVAKILACATPTRKWTEMFYAFGEVTSTVNMPNDLESLNAVSDPEDISIELSIRTADERGKFADRFIGFGSDISACLMSSGFMIEPDLLSVLLRLRGDLNEMQTMKQLIDTEKLEAERFDIFAAHINQVASSAAVVARWLESRATRKTSFEDVERELLLKIEAKLASKGTGPTNT